MKIELEANRLVIALVVMSIVITNFNAKAADNPVAFEEQTNKSTEKSSEIALISKSQESQKFTGSPITLNLKDADVHEVLRMISETSGFNIIIHPSVQGKITLSLDHVPWDQALDVVLNTLKLGAERNESVLRVLPKEMLYKEKQDDLDQRKLSQASAPRITRIFPISYAEMPQLSSLLSQFINSQNNGPGGSAIPATILIDQNTQSLIVRDTSENVDRIKKMIDLLDVQTPQVMIEAKVVEATEDFSSGISGSLGTGIEHYGLSSNNTVVSTLAGAQSLNSIVGTSTTAISGLYSMQSGTAALTAALNYSETLGKTKIVSSPKQVVLSGKSASISQTTGQTVAVQLTAGSGTGTITDFKTFNAVTKLDVTPRVTNDGSVFMKLSINRDLLVSKSGQPVVEPRTLITEVIVESGNTLVIGGVLNIDETENESGIPFLRKIPLIGSFFGSEIKTRAKRELMIFVTPKILNQKKTAINSGLDEKDRT